MKGRGAARPPGGREGEGGLQTPDQERAGRSPPLGRRRPGAASPPQVPQRASARCDWAPAPASRRSCPGVPGCRRARAGARGRGRCPAARGAAPETAVRSGGPDGRASPFPTAPPPGPSCLGRDGFRLSELRQARPWSLLWGCLGFPGLGLGLDPVTQPCLFILR